MVRGSNPFPVEHRLERQARASASARARTASAPTRLEKAGALVREHRLRNGMRILLAERHSDPVVAVMLLYKVGARNETPAEAGVSHFLEHMMFKGTKRLGKGEVDRLTTALGGQNNAFTGYDHTAYWFELASDRWETALDIEADRMHGLLLDPAEFDAERDVVLEELAMGEDDPWRALMRQVETIVFARHPYGRPIIGYPDTLRGMTPDAMRDYYRRFYHVGNATLVVCGDIRSTSALAAIKKRFGALSAHGSYDEADCYRPPLETPRSSSRVSMTWDDQAQRLCMAWPTTAVGSPADYALDVALTVLTSGRMSRLQRRLVLDEGLATSISASNDTRIEGGAFWLLAECAQGVEPARLDAELDRELQRLATEKVPASELRRAKTLLKASEAYDGETVSDLAEELGEFAVDADWRMAFDGGERHAAVTADLLRRTVAEYLIPTRRTLGWCHPQDAQPETRSSAKSKRRGGKRAARRTR